MMHRTKKKKKQKGRILWRTKEAVKFLERLKENILLHKRKKFFNKNLNLKEKTKNRVLEQDPASGLHHHHHSIIHIHPTEAVDD